MELSKNTARQMTVNQHEFIEKATGLVSTFHYGGKSRSEYVELGDRHNGKNVLHLKYVDHVGYIAKPRSSFGENLLAEVESKVFSALGLDLQINHVIAKIDTVSLFNFIATSELHLVDIERYFYTTGVRGALLFCLLATDISYENVICTKDGPVVIDAETLFTPYSYDLHANMPSYDLCIDYCSLARTGFFTSNYLFSPIVNQRQLSKLADSNVSSLHQEISLFPICNKQTNSIARGFRDSLRIFRELLDKKFIDEMLISDKSGLCSLRIVLRPTYQYLAYLNGGAGYDIEFSLMELEQLKNGDIPYFTHESLDSKICPKKVMDCVRKMTEFAERNPSIIYQQIQRQEI